MKKKLFFFLLTVVCTLLCAPPASAKVIIHDNSTANWPSDNMGVYFSPGCSSWDDSRKMYREGESNYYSYNIGNATIAVFRELGNGQAGNQTKNISNPVNFGIYKSGGWINDPNSGNGLNRDVTKVGDATFAIHGTIFGDSNWTSKNMTKKNGKWVLENVTLSSGDFGIKVLSGSTQAAWLFAPTTSTGNIVSGTAKPVVLQGQGGANIHSTITGNQTITFDPDAMTITIGTSMPTVGALTFNPASGAIKTGNTVTITCATENPTIYYTVDGSDPKTSSTRKVYNNTNKPVLTTSNKTLKAYATKSGYNDSAVKTVTYTVMPEFGPDLKVYIGGSDFNYIGEGETWNGYGADWDNWGFELPAMKWDAEKGWYTMTIQPKSGKTSISYGFLINSNNNPTWFNTNQANAVQNDKDEPDTWSSPFSSNVSAMSNSGLSDTRLYKVFVKQDPQTGGFMYAITRLPQEMKPYKVSLDVSQMGARKWDAAVAVAGGNTYNFTSLVDDVINFSFEAGIQPSKIYFKSSADATSPVDITNQFDFVDGKTYTIGFINSYRKDNLSYAWQEINLTQEAKKVNLPYGPNDFKEPKYFLVGTRMGNWHLQPEWELIKQADGSYKVNGGRFVFRTNFGVAKVNSYYNYTQQIYQLVTRANSSGDASLITPTKTTIEGLAQVDPDNTVPEERFFDTSAFGYQEALDPNYADTRSAKEGGLAMTFAYNGAWDNENYEDAAHPNTNRMLSARDKGTWVNEIKLTPNNNGQSFNLSFSINPDNVVNIDQRMFSLVGGDINHKGYLNGQYSPDGTDAKIVTNRSMSGLKEAWQEAWIQYDENGKPYYDGNGQFLYHTAFVPSIFDDTEVKFQLDVNGKKFDYSSSAVTFVEANQLSDLTNDPYRELYTALAGNKEFKEGTPFTGGTKEEGTYFAFQLGDISRDFEADQTNWKVFVIRDAWVKGEFKIWNGWSGNSNKYEMFDGNSGKSYGDGADGARWNRLNAGPEGNVAQAVERTDINAGIDGTNAQTPDKLSVIENGTDVNYKVDELTYFNRIILLYNTAQDNALDNSYVFFIQADAQPVIKGFANNKKASYDWNLVNVKSGSDAIITGYTITRYMVTADGNINPKVVKTETGLNLKVDGFEIKHDEEENELNPGTYFYNLKVNYKGSDGKSDVREANSNRFVIYGDAIAPQLRVEQLIVLTKAGYDAIMGTRYAEDDAFKSTGYPNLKTRFEQAFGSATYAADRFYLTYINDNLDADHYAIYAAPMGQTGAAMNQNVTQMTQVVPQEVINFMKEPDYYKWAARFYVRALDKTAFDREYSRQNITVEDLQIKLTDVAAADLTAELKGAWETNSIDMATSTYTVSKLSGGTNQYRGSIVDRNGFLGAGTMRANMTYKYGVNEAETKDEVEFTPVVPLPYDLSAKYVYRAETFGNPLEDHLNGKFQDNLIRGFKGHIKVQTHSTAHPKEGEHEPYTVTIPEQAISQERHLDCVFEFTRPNVSEAIFKHYNVQYTISVQPVVEEGASFADMQGYTIMEPIKGTYEDTSEIEVDDDGNRLFDDNGDPVRTPYQITVPNTHPSGKIYPEFQITSVVYERAADFGGGKYRLEATYQYDPLYIVRSNTRSAEFTPGEFGLGYNAPNLNKETAPRWYIMAHKDFSYGGATPSTDVNTEVFADTQVFMIELTNADGKTVAGKSLWWHNDKDNCISNSVFATKPGMGGFSDEAYNDYKFERDPFLINNLEVAEGETPQITITPVYLFIRDLSVDVNSSAKFRDLEPVKGSAAAKRRGVIRRADENTGNTTGFAIKEGNAILLDTASGGQVEADKYDASEHGLILGATYDATVNHPEFVVSPGDGKVPTNDNDEPITPPVMTGIEDVMTDGAAVSGEAVYYNLQGIQVVNPVKGQIYIRKAGNVTEKVVY